MKGECQTMKLLNPAIIITSRTLKQFKLPNLLVISNKNEKHKEEDTRIIYK